MRAQNELCEAYDIARSVLLPFYEAGDSINPKVEENVCDYLDFYRGVTSEDTYRTLMGEGPRERCAWLAYQNRYITLRDKDREKIFDDIMAHPESFARYYPMARVVANTRAVEATVRTFVTNDELWAHMVELTENRPA